MAKIVRFTPSQVEKIETEFESWYNKQKILWPSIYQNDLIRLEAGKYKYPYQQVAWDSWIQGRIDLKLLREDMLELTRDNKRLKAHADHLTDVHVWRK